MYDAVKYWSGRAVPNQPGIDIDTSKHIEFLKKHIGSCKSILDFGPGTGRLFEAYVGSSCVEGYDVADRHKSELIRISNELGIKFRFTLAKGVGNMPYIDKQFDLSVAAEVLLHQKPGDIRVIMSELVRVSNKAIVITWMEDGALDGRKIFPHCFHYNYIDICNECGWDMRDFTRYKRQIMFVYEEK